MKDLNLLVWLTQLGLSVAAPLAGFILLAVWLQEKLGWGQWILWVGVLLGVIGALSGLYSSLKILSRLSQNNREAETSPVSFDDHD